MTRTKALLLVLLMVGVAIVGISFSSAWFNALRPNVATELQSDMRHEVRASSGAVGEGWEQIDATLRFEVEHPTTVALNDAFIVSARCEVADLAAYSVSVGPRLNSKRPLDLSESELTERMQRLFGGPGIGTEPKAGFELVMAGTEIAPNTPQTGALGTPVSWSVRSNTKGSLQGFVRLVWLADEADPSERWGLNVDENSYFTVQVTDGIWNFANVSTWFARFVGTLLTIPGILLSILGAMRGNKQQPEVARSRLILPGDKF